MPRAKARIWATYLGRQPKKAREIQKRMVGRRLKREIKAV